MSKEKPVSSEIPEETTSTEVLEAPQQTQVVEFDDTSYSDPDPADDISGDPPSPAESEQTFDQPTEQPETDVVVPVPESSIEGSETEVVWDTVSLSAAGLTEAQAREQFKTPEALEHAVRILDSKFIQQGQQQLGGQQYPVQPNIPQSSEPT